MALAWAPQVHPGAGRGSILGPSAALTSCPTSSVIVLVLAKHDAHHTSAQPWMGSPFLWKLTVLHSVYIVGFLHNVVDGHAV